MVLPDGAVGNDHLIGLLLFRSHQNRLHLAFHGAADALYYTIIIELLGKQCRGRGQCADAEQQHRKQTKERAIGLFHRKPPFLILQRSARRSRMPYFTTTTVGFLYPGLTGHGKSTFTQKGLPCKTAHSSLFLLLSVYLLMERVPKAVSSKWLLYSSCISLMSERVSSAPAVS